MRFSAVLAVFVSSVSSLSIFGGDQAALSDDDLKIPGDSPLELCEGTHDEDLIAIESVDLAPNPPKAGQTLIIKASGTVKEQIEEGAYVNLQVKYGLIRLISTKADLCEQIKNVDMECPIEKGDMVITKSVDLPNEIPPGKYTVFGDVFTVDDERITCITATVVFSRTGSGSLVASLEL